MFFTARSTPSPVRELTRCRPCVESGVGGGPSHVSQAYSTHERAVEAEAIRAALLGMTGDCEEVRTTSIMRLNATSSSIHCASLSRSHSCSRSERERHRSATRDM